MNKLSYWIGFISENCHHNYGSDTASYSINEGKLTGFTYKLALDKFKEMVESQDYCEILLFNSEDKLIKSESWY
jgi:hypothetical protein